MFVVDAACRPIEPMPVQPNVFWTQPPSGLPAYDEIPAAVGGVDKPVHSGNYEHLHRSRNFYDDFAPPVPPPGAVIVNNNPPPPPVKPKPMKPAPAPKPEKVAASDDEDDGTYLHFSE